MALGTLGAALAGSAVAGAAKFGLGALFGGGSSSKQLAAVQPTGFFAGGLSSGMSGNNATVTPTAERMKAVQSLSELFPEQADLIAQLRSKFAQGVSDLRRSRMNEIDNAGVRAIGDLRDNMARRRMLGSSFGQDALSRVELEIGKERDRVAAESTLQEVEGTLGLLGQEYQARQGEFKTLLDEMNLEANLAAGLAGKATDVMSKNAQVAAALKMKENEGLGTLIGKASSGFTDALGKSVTDWMK